MQAVADVVKQRLFRAGEVATSIHSLQTLLELAFEQGLFVDKQEATDKWHARDASNQPVTYEGGQARFKVCISHRAAIAAAAHRGAGPRGSTAAGSTCCAGLCVGACRLGPPRADSCLPALRKTCATPPSCAQVHLCCGRHGIPTSPLVRWRSRPS